MENNFWFNRGGENKRFKTYPYSFYKTDSEIEELARLIEEKCLNMGHVLLRVALVVLVFIKYIGLASTKRFQHRKG